jgi:GNAT superfamily N-acetyltransferase
MEAARRRVDGEFTHRLASPADRPELQELIARAVEELQRGFLTPAQISASRSVMGLDSQLVDDGTYFVVRSGARIVGCGGWSRRATLYGGDHSGGRDASWLDPARDPARVRAMYTHPDFTRRGIGRLILSLCEEAATAAGFGSLELMATLSGRPLYESAGFGVLEHVTETAGGVPVPLLRMRKEIPRAI